MRIEKKATREADGAIWSINSSHLPPNEPSMSTKPVMLPPGFAKLAANPLPTGSETAANTIGIVRVAACNAAVAGVVIATNTSAFRPTSSFATSCIRSTLPAPQAPQWKAAQIGNGFDGLKGLML